ncbi:MAG: N-formylglutamate amidohydrolase [Planctomycetes bacterium]|nr:N-formylglutamate amidohydrolase [Planctomycetota bacterium]
MNLVLSCEHGGNRLPARYRSVFWSAQAALESHRGWDAGSLQLARQLARRLSAPLVSCATSRLLIDLNRSLNHPRLFSEWSRCLPLAERERLIERWWYPHRDELAAWIGTLEDAPVLHLSVHSFTPVLDGVERDVDVGLLYDPKRPRERDFVADFVDALQERAPDLRVRRNQPYRGTSDGLTTAFRKRFRPTRYLGVELEVSQRFPLGPAAEWRRLRDDLCKSLSAALD